jgi:hypothetical protein
MEPHGILWNLTVYDVYSNQKSEQSYLSIAAWCGDTGLITVGVRTEQT